MIKLTDAYSAQPIIVNPDLIEVIRCSPTFGETLVQCSKNTWGVKETPEQILNMIELERADGDKVISVRAGDMVIVTWDRTRVSMEEVEGLDQDLLLPGVKVVFLASRAIYDGGPIDITIVRPETATDQAKPVPQMTRKIKLA